MRCALIAALDEPRAAVRRSVVSALGSAKSPLAVAPLMKLYKDPDVQKEAITALAATPGLSALDAYLEGLAGKDAGLRNRCETAVAAIHEQALPLIEARLESNPLDSAAQKIVIKKSDIARRTYSDLSLMPEGMQTGLKPEEFSDLIAYLESLKK
jgi:HEAT repeat protein